MQRAKLIVIIANNYNATRMFHVTGRISGKKPMKSGVSSKGEWKIILFSITKRYQRKQIHLWFTAKGKKAELVTKLRLNDKIDIEFLPQHQSKGEHLFSENVVIDLHLSKKRPNWDDTNEVDEPEVEFQDTLNLQSAVDKQSKHYNGKNRAATTK